MDLTNQYQDEVVFKLSVQALSSIRLFHEIEAVFLNALAYGMQPSIFIRGEVIVGKPYIRLLLNYYLCQKSFYM